MDRIGQLAFWGFVINVAWIRLTYDDVATPGTPLQSSIIAYGVAGLLLLGAARFLPFLFDPPSLPPQNDQILPSSARAPPKDSSPEPLSFKVLRSYFRSSYGIIVAIVVALSVRVELARQIVTRSECAATGPEFAAPFIIAFCDYLYAQRQTPDPRQETSGVTTLATTWRVIAFSRARYLLPAFLMGLGCSWAVSSASGIPSTYICPIVRGYGYKTPMLQCVGICLDLWPIILTLDLSPPRADKGSNATGRRLPILWAWAFLISAFSSTLVRTISVLASANVRSRTLTLQGWYLQSVIWQSLSFAIQILTLILLAPRIGALGVAMTAAFVYTYIFVLSSLWTHRYPFPPFNGVYAMASVGIAFCAMLLFLVVMKATAHEHRARPRIYPYLYSLLVFLFLLLAVTPSTRTDISKDHPIDLLIRNAKTEHDDWLKQASSSTTLGKAVEEYRRRYDRHPPPGFEHWYEYATNRSSIGLDDYDAIFTELLPFWSLQPFELRKMTWQMVSNPWNEISGISIRGGKAEIQENVLPTHRWMLQGVADMINNFAQWVPDMDLAFNLNDECRVAVPHAKMQAMRLVGERAGDLSRGKQNSWSPDRSSGWTEVRSADVTIDSVFQDSSFRDTFQRFGAVGCPPDSRARQERIWDHRYLCTTCAEPHSMGQFVRNWTLAADICHQPDASDLHGFYLSPAAFKTSHELRPVFSQSKAHGYSDILYPSAWNYMDKVRYEPSDDHPDVPFAQKQNTLFWRGATSEGVSDHGTWKGMARQRLVHLANNLTASDKATVLLSDPAAPGRYVYRSLSGTQLAALNLSIDVHIVEKIARCGGIDCDDQAREFGLVAPSDFQDHWKHRYLFDLDGAGFSGRFLPFLQSHSLPFKSALFREWSDPRLQAWLHFVPQDLRLHGVHSTLAYFAGADATAQATADGAVAGPGKMDAHVREGERIAEEGRAWARKALRKEDMEVYFFRLLLEWGRLTDDRRENIGFQLG